jgi:hypothetical protein
LAVAVAVAVAPPVVRKLQLAVVVEILVINIIFCFQLLFFQTSYIFQLVQAVRAADLRVQVLPAGRVLPAIVEYIRLPPLISYLAYA